MLDLGLTAALQNVEKSHQIALDVSVRIGQRIAYSGLGCQVHDALRLLARKQLVHAGTVGQIKLDKVKPLVTGQQGEACLFEPDIVVGVEIVDARLKEARLVRV